MQTDDYIRGHGTKDNRKQGKIIKLIFDTPSQIITYSSLINHQNNYNDLILGLIHQWNTMLIKIIIKKTMKKKYYCYRIDQYRLSLKS